MSDDLSVFSSPELKNVVQDMRDLLSQSRLAFLLGAGCSKIAGLPLMPARVGCGEARTASIEILRE